MKRILLSILTIALLVVACDNKDVPEVIDKGKLDPSAVILIKPAKGVQLRAFVPGLTATEIVEQTVNIKWRTQWSFMNDDIDPDRHEYWDEPKEIARGFSEAQIDLSIPALKMWSTDVIGQNGSLAKDFIYGTDIYLTDSNNDTIGYVPQNVIDNARILIEAAYNDDNYTEVYRLFDEAFTFRPIEKPE